MKKNHLLIVTAFTCFIGNVNAQPPNWLWARAATGSGAQEGFSAATDDSGSVFVTGYFNWFPITFGTITLANGGGYSIYLVKYDGVGNVLWAKRAGGNGTDWSNGTAADDSGNVFITGWFNSSPITFGTITLTGAGFSATMFLVKYDGAGNTLWAKIAGGNGSNYGYSTATDASGNVFVTGYFASDTITFDTTTLINTGGHNAIFLVKYDGAGNVLWAKNSIGTNNDEGLNTSTDASGNVFVTGYFYSPVITFGTTTLTNSGGCTNVFLVKYDGAGNVLWAKSAGGTGCDIGYSTATDAAGNVFLTGCFSSPTITFGTTTLTNDSAGTLDVFLVKYDGAGNILWAKRAGGTNNDIGYNVATDASGNVYVSGGFLSSSIIFDSDTLLFPAGAGDPMFLVKYSPTGNVLCASSLASGGDDWSGLATDTFGNVFFGGDIYVVDTLVVGMDSLPRTGQETVFVAKYRCTAGGGVGVNELSNEEEINIYPNPATNHFTIALTSRNKKVEITITDITRKIIYSITTRETRKIEVNTKDFAGGVYVVRIQATDFIETKKLIVVK